MLYISFAEFRALYSYEGQQEGDLSFNADDHIIVFEALDNGWWRGCHGDNEGWFPATYVEVQLQLFFDLTNLVNSPGNSS